MLNVIAIQGRLAADPERRQTTTGKAVCTFRIACDRGRKDANGNSLTDWIPCTAWEKTADFICKYFPKGSMIALDGRLQSRTYQDKNGQNRTALEIVVNNASFCGSKETAHPAQENGVQRTAAALERTSSEEYEPIIADGEDLPF